MSEPTDDTRAPGPRPPPDPAPSARAPDAGFWSEDDELTLVQFIAHVLRARRLVAAAAVVAAVLFVGITLLLPRTYTSGAGFMPQAGEAQASRLASLAAQIGFSLPTGEAGESPEFYADLLRSQALLRAAVETEYDVPKGRTEGEGDALQGNLVEIFGTHGRNDAVRAVNAVEKLRDRLSVGTKSETGVVTFSVRTRWPALSRAIANRLLELLNEFNLETRQSNAAAERRFIEERLRESQRALEAAEDTVEDFVRRNRRYEGAPELQFAYDRLQRRVALQQQIHTSLSESYEKAKIEEVRNTPVITVVEPPVFPVKPNRRRLILKGIVGLAVGALGALLWVLGREFLADARRRDPGTYRELETLRRETREDVRRLLSRLRRRRPPAGP
ncbi:MAG: hypothetical protein ACE5HF_05105 [Gemmatimonadota bacterium]